MPHGPSAPLNGKIIIIAAVSSTCTTQKIFSLTDLSKKKTRVPLTTTQYTLPKLQFTNTKAHGSHQVSLVPHGPSALLNGKIIIIAAVSSTCTTQKIFSLTELSKKKTRILLTTTQYCLPKLQFTNTKAHGSHQVSLVPHGPSAPLNGKIIIIAAVSSTCTTQKIFSLTDFSKGSPHHHTILSAQTSVHQHRSKNGSHQVTFVPHGLSAPLKGKIIIIAAVSSTCTTQKIFSLTDFSKKKTRFPSPPHNTLPKLRSTNSKAHASHQVSLVPHGPSTPLNGKIIIIATVSSTSTTQKIFSLTTFSKKKTRFPSSPHNTLPKLQSTNTKAHGSHQSFFGASRSISAAQWQNYHHRRCFINVYHTKYFQSNRPFKEKTRVPLTTTQYSAQTSVHQHKSTRPTSSFFGASRSVSAAQRQNYHHRRCFFNVYHAKDFQSNRPFKEKTRVPSPPHNTLPKLQFTNTKAHGSHQVSLVPHGPSAPLNGKMIIIGAVASTCTTQKIFSLTDFSIPPHNTLCPNFSPPTQKQKRLTSSFFGASRSVSAAQRQNYHHRRCCINVYHTKIFSLTDFSV